jgi:hypothetical protein
MSMPRDENVNIHLPGYGVQRVQIPRWDTLMAMNNPYSDGRMGDGQGERGGDRLVGLVKVRKILVQLELRTSS